MKFNGTTGDIENGIFDMEHEANDNKNNIERLHRWKSSLVNGVWAAFYKRRLARPALSL